MNKAREVMLNVFGFNDFKSDEQRIAIESILEGNYKNIIINMATQAGKSLCYQLPGVIKNEEFSFSLVVSPSRALIHNHLDYLHSLGINALYVDGEMDREVQKQFCKDIEGKKMDPRFIFVTPEMLHINLFLWEKIDSWLKQKRINYTIIEEAHKIIDSVHFRESFSCLESLRKSNKDIPMITLTCANNNDRIAEALKMEQPLILSSSSVRRNIFYESFRMVKENAIIDFYRKLVRADKNNPSGIIFCLRRSTMNEIVRNLNSSGLGQIAIAYTTITDVDRWLNREFPIIAATGESFGFGLNYNLPPISFVIHLGMPNNLISFYHESGRAGNDGKMGFSRVYGSGSFRKGRELFERYHRASCKRQFMAAQFGEKIEKCCLCDSCAYAKMNN